ncbi:halocyanin domain-containing protein [Halorarius halobius]|uniref:halocyanin domain-containing protein n=1 Tax=Halorarius halobius TaxID=2962671 RepID=UPI0020CE5945|nr:halocyanin domain-containing protein [Halorarius halobius]
MPTRRAFLKTATVGTAAAAVGTGRAAAGTDLSGWLSNTDGATEVVDRTGNATVEVAVGAEGNGGAFGFGPPVVRVDPGTTVRWTWTQGSHNVVAKDGRFESPMQSEGSFERTFETAGVAKYYCAPHKAMGMKGAVVVGDREVTLPGGATPTPSSDEGDEGTAGETRSFDGWLAETDNYDGVRDLRGNSEVTVEVGAEGNGGPLAFAPAAIHVDPGTVVRFEWVGPRQYDVVDPELGIESEQVASEGHIYAVQFDGDGLATYECTTYGDQGMRGVVVVGEGPQEQVTWQGVAAMGGAAAVLSAPLALGLRLHERTATTGDE